MDFFGTGRWNLCESVPKNHEKYGVYRTARPEAVAWLGRGAGVVFCLCSWVAV